MFEFITITFFILLATISPGPDFAIVSRNSLRYSQKIGMMTALGISFGTLLHSCYCLLGFAIIISRSLLVFTIIKYLGAIYLIYLGIKGLFEKNSSIQIDTSKCQNNLSAYQAFRQGLLCTLLNPKAILFFIAFFTIIIKPSVPFYLQAIYVIEIVMIDILWFSIISYIFSHHKMKMMLGASMHYVTKVFGGFLVVFGLKIATMAR